MIRYFILLLLAPAICCHAQSKVKDMKPTKIGTPLTFDLQEEMEYNILVEKCEEFWQGVDANFDENNLNKEDRKVYEDCKGDFKEYWSVLDIGCSWYCGGGQDSLSATSALSAYGDIGYDAANAHDLNYKTAWVEGVEGYGIGEVLTYHIQPTNPRISEIIVVNGYVKSEKAWRNNSRVKTLKMYVDDEIYGVLHLKDIKAEQHFKIKPLGVKNRADYDSMKKLPVWTIKFEILDVYKGEKYDDTAITEIYFDGIDVH